MTDPELLELLTKTMDDMGEPRVADTTARIRGGRDAIVLPKEAVEAMRRAYELGRADLERLRDPVTLHVNLLRGFPAQLTMEQRKHLVGSVGIASMRDAVLEEAARAICYGCSHGWRRGHHKEDREPKMLMHYTTGNADGEPGHSCFAEKILELKEHRPHIWVPSTLGHGETMCTVCAGTNRELAAMGQLERCPGAGS